MQKNYRLFYFGIFFWKILEFSCEATHNQPQIANFCVYRVKNLKSNLYLGKTVWKHYNVIIFGLVSIFYEKILEGSWLISTLGGFLYGWTRKSAYFLNSIWKNCISFGGIQKTGKLSDRNFYIRRMAYFKRFYPTDTDIA